MRVPMRGTGADQPVVVRKSRNGDGAKGLDYLSLLFGQPVMGGTRRQGKVAIKGNWMIRAGGRETVTSGSVRAWG